jgi:hypothetical protein
MLKSIQRINKLTKHSVLYNAYNRKAISTVPKAEYYENEKEV